MQNKPNIKKTTAKMTKKQTVSITPLEIPETYSTLLVEPKKKEKKQIDPLSEVSSSLINRIKQFTQTLNAEDSSSDFNLKDSYLILKRKFLNLSLEKDFLAFKSQSFEYIFNSLINLNDNIEMCEIKMKLNDFLKTHVSNFYEIYSAGFHEKTEAGFIFSLEKRDFSLENAIL